MKVSKLLVVTSLLAAAAVVSLQIKESRSAKVAESPAESDHHDKSSESDHSHEGEKGHDHKEEMHDQENSKHDHEHEDKHNHDEEGHADEQVHKEDEHGDEHGHGEEENSSVGIDKGIAAADEVNGIKLSAEAIRNFELKTVKLQGAGPWTISPNAILYSGEEINIYRLRDGFYKRIDFILLSKESGSVLVKGKELAGGDEVVVHGVGFLRTAELVAFGGAPEGHSH